MTFSLFAESGQHDDASRGKLPANCNQGVDAAAHGILRRSFPGRWPCTQSCDSLQLLFQLGCCVRGFFLAREHGSHGPGVFSTHLVIFSSETFVVRATMIVRDASAIEEVLFDPSRSVAS
jgi:hypothetical protein